ncbi:MAG: hypothetical protein ABI863_16435 [Ginsengibacter sp.]
MKFFLLFFILFLSVNCNAQKYALLDQHLVQPVTYSNKVTSADKFNDLFPVEKQMMRQFIDALQAIENKLSTKGPFDKAKQYEAGCAKFTGINVRLASEERLDYVLTSSCDNVKISMHLCDAKISNASNIYFIKTWIKYIQSYLK